MGEAAHAFDHDWIITSVEVEEVETRSVALEFTAGIFHYLVKGITRGTAVTMISDEHDFIRVGIVVEEGAELFGVGDGVLTAIGIIEPDGIWCLVKGLLFIGLHATVEHLAEFVGVGVGGAESLLAHVVFTGIGVA